MYLPNQNLGSYMHHPKVNQSQPTQRGYDGCTYYLNPNINPSPPPWFFQSFSISHHSLNLLLFCILLTIGSLAQQTFPSLKDDQSDIELYTLYQSLGTRDEPLSLQLLGEYISAGFSSNTLYLQLADIWVKVKSK